MPRQPDRPHPTAGDVSLAIAERGARHRAQGALDDIVALGHHQGAAARRLRRSPPDPLFQLDLATADTELRAARALLYETAEAAWTAPSRESTSSRSSSERSPGRRGVGDGRAAAGRGTAYRAGGGSSLYADSPLQRRLRDIQPLTQHFLVRRDTLITAGAILAGNSVDLPLF